MFWWVGGWVIMAFYSFVFLHCADLGENGRGGHGVKNPPKKRVVLVFYEFFCFVLRVRDERREHQVLAT